MKFPNIAALVREKRSKTPFSQKDVGQLVGFNSAGQFISNIERGMCTVPVNKIGDVTFALKCSSSEVIEAMVCDYREKLLKRAEEQTTYEYTDDYKFLQAKGPTL